MLTIRRAAAADQPQIMAIYRTAQEYMLQTGNPTQWGRSYPSPELIRSDIAQGICRVLSDEAGIHGVFALLDTPEPTYSRIEGAWRNDAPYLTIHRLAGDGRTHGLFRCAADCGTAPIPGRWPGGRRRIWIWCGRGCCCMAAVNLPGSLACDL